MRIAPLLLVAILLTFLGGRCHAQFTASWESFPEALAVYGSIQNNERKGSGLPMLAGNLEDCSGDPLGEQAEYELRFQSGILWSRSL